MTSRGRGHGRGHGRGVRYGNRGREDATVEERMLDRINEKMNKFAESTYSDCKGWLCELLSGDNTGFLKDFIQLVFDKAAAETILCPLYAKLLTELSASFTHLSVELTRIFGEFLDIFTEAAEEPDVGSAAYAAYVALRSRRKFRRGYALFIGHIASLGAISKDDVIRTCGVILDGLLAAKAAEGKGSLCEEYADCLTSLMKASVDLIKSSAAATLARVNEAKVKGGSLTNKARFALMDLTDLF